MTLACFAGGIFLGYVIAVGRVARVMARSLDEHRTLLDVSDSLAEALIPGFIERAVRRKVDRDRAEQSDEKRTG